jgi:hypothetical protein
MDTKYIEMLVSALPSNVLIALSSGGIASLVIIYLARNWISERLKQSIGHEYAQKLPTWLKREGHVSSRLRPTR